MQTAAASPQEVREGIEAGAYYYLTKPYAPESLLAIVRAALADLDSQAALSRRIEDQSSTLELMLSGEFRFASPAEVTRLAGLLAGLCPAPDMAVMGLAELMLNAVEHGNLGISYADKTRLRLAEQWESEVQQRLALPENLGKFATIRMERRPDEISFEIADSGVGFEWQKYLEFDADRAFDPNGRGIAMARAMSFCAIEYMGCGNRVRARIAL
jgi:hypothetical protein